MGFRWGCIHSGGWDMCVLHLVHSANSIAIHSEAFFFFIDFAICLTVLVSSVPYILSVVVKPCSKITLEYNCQSIAFQNFRKSQRLGTRPFADNKTNNRNHFKYVWQITRYSGREAFVHQCDHTWIERKMKHRTCDEDHQTHSIDMRYVNLWDL